MAEYVDREKILNDPMLHTYKKKDLLEKIKSMPTTCEVSVLPCKKGDTDYTGLVKELRALSKHVPEQMCDDNGIDPLEKAADAIETLLAEMTDYISREMVKQVIDKAIEQADSLQRLPLMEVSAVISNLPTALKKDG